MPPTPKPHLILLATLALATQSLPTRAQPAPPLVSPPLTQADYTRALDRGQEMLAHAKWNVVIPGGVAEINPTAGLLLCKTINAQTDDDTFALDPDTGKTLWKTNWFSLKQSTQTNAGILESLPKRFSGDSGWIGKYTIAKDTGKVAYAWDVTIAGKPDGYTLPSVIFAGQHVLAVGGFGAKKNSTGSEPTQLDLWVRAFDSKTGKQLWNTSLDAAAVSAPVLANGKIYLVLTLPTHDKDRSPHSILLALNAADGKPAFSAPMPGRVSLPAVDAALAVIARDSGDVVALDANTGVEKWHRRISPDCDSDKSWITANDVVGATPVLNGSRVWIPIAQTTRAAALPTPSPTEPGNSHASGFAAFDLSSSKQLAYFNAPLPPQPGSEAIITQSSHSEIRGNLLLVCCGPRNSILMAINTQTLHLEWILHAATRHALTDNTLFINAAFDVSNRQKESTLYALTLDTK